ncbi:hypothetical protein [Salsipaludibacter albus]|uniref:hypothetical protein n=1 Tax=Salsipaludibacter albus TaxID=2849650 RepID=UPI001EE3D6E6|nr:hypothetical protein [Salsipaludibacter albus]MBY5163279.1 hypothetical protein [Salsipaludibacter albus]
MGLETIAGELAGRPTLDRTGPDDAVRACLIVEDHPTLPEILTVELRGRNAVVVADRLASANGQPVSADIWTSPVRDPNLPYRATRIEPALAHPDAVTTPGLSMTRQLHEQIIDLYAVPVAEVLAGIRPPRSVGPLLHPSLADKFARLARPLGRGRVAITASHIQAGHPRIDIAAAVRIGDRTHPLSVGVNVTGQQPVIDTVMSPRLRIRSMPRPPALGVTRLQTSQTRPYSPGGSAGHTAHR